MEIHPAPIGHFEALVQLALLQRLFRVLVAAVAYEQGCDVGVHVVGAGLDASHALVIGQLFALVIDLFRQVGHIEQVHILKAVGFPKLGFFRQHVFRGFRIKIHLRRQRLPVLLAQPHVKFTAVNITQTVHSFFTRHGSTVLSTCAATTLLSFLSRF